jgi:hypothetical protein
LASPTELPDSSAADNATERKRCATTDSARYAGNLPPAPLFWEK